MIVLNFMMGIIRPAYYSSGIHFTFLMKLLSVNRVAIGDIFNT